MTDEQIISVIRFFEDGGVDTSFDNIQDELKCHKEVLRVQLKRMIRFGLLWTTKSRYFCTNEGLSLLEQAIEEPYPVEDWCQWRDEVLTGIDNDGNETEIINPALPKNKHEFKNHAENQFISEISKAGRIREIIQNHPWLSVDKLAEYWHDGLIVQCAQCGELAAHKRYKNGSKGKVCINCQRSQKC
jgi:DNA-binding HxlR family transcriptional regulator